MGPSPWGAPQVHGCDLQELYQALLGRTCSYFRDVEGTVTLFMYTYNKVYNKKSTLWENLLYQTLISQGKGQVGTQSVAASFLSQVRGEKAKANTFF